MLFISDTYALHCGRSRLFPLILRHLVALLQAHGNLVLLCLLLIHDIRAELELANGGAVGLVAIRCNNNSSNDENNNNSEVLTNRMLSGRSQK